ncbi:hypothetical protein Cni_G02329 [Canna indica]|uniref:Uncharacterized protein n=1 Tax=Canna indica TaxID=4628 RepID=A0AAQ3JR34_9LILI|nr:hypothetical protein Cni_G02329 [Canna indica]
MTEAMKEVEMVMFGAINYLVAMEVAGGGGGVASAEGVGSGLVGGGLHRSISSIAEGATIAANRVRLTTQSGLLVFQLLVFVVFQVRMEFASHGKCLPPPAAEREAEKSRREMNDKIN